ncbi:MAG TPA: glycerol kinase GlpK [Bacteroidales bacterium]|nr:glycerol kinase GlpK [Bacteroidales bacterium]HPR11970.1 glycerol kinase GlpK [Bacteroidales bacterium]HRW86427.1 glycerol kinase GlpK [Bacteroidales bacterium]
MTEKYILAVDQSTSATKVMMFGKKAEIVTRVTLPHQQFYPRPGFVEHDAEEIYSKVVSGLRQVVDSSRIGPESIAAIAITNQRETSLIWEKTTGKPIAHAAVWQCQRGASYCDQLKKEGREEMVREKTGMLIDPYFSASKLRWIINNTPGAKEKARDGQLLLGTIDSWLLWKLSGGKVHATDYSNACRTLLLNINTLEWDEELMQMFHLQPDMFPALRFSDEIFGYTDDSVLPGFSIPVAGLMGDSHAALFGQNCFIPGMAKATYGTGSSIMMNIGTAPHAAPTGLVTSIGYCMNKKVDYVYEGNIHCTGDTINWLKNELQLIGSAAEPEALANSVEKTCGVYLVPAFVGLGAPYWDNSARASITGINRDTTKAHIVRAALESIAYQVKDLIDLMVNEGGMELKELRVDGGPTRNNFLMQFQCDILGCEVVRSSIEEVSALGSAFMAGLATGLWKDLGEIKALYNSDHTFKANKAPEEAEKLYSGWKKAVERTRS